MYQAPCRTPYRAPVFALAGLLSAAAFASLAQTAATAAAPTVPPQPDQRVVIEDDGVRIEETRRQGQVVRVQVQSKVANSRGYDIVVKPSAEAASQQRGNAGRSAWNLLSF